LLVVLAYRNFQSAIQSPSKSRKASASLSRKINWLEFFFISSSGKNQARVYRLF